ncbi:MAG: kynureninase [Gemmatimonadota bacterium]|nr:MAG: kynureninase [Gemmatimonadota bacterium]
MGHSGALVRLDPEALAPHYSRFRVSERLLLTGHSHQAWPDVAFEGQKQAWLDAAEFADLKWEKAEAKAELLRQGVTKLLDDPGGHIALAPNTHELVVRFLSALPLRERSRLVTTDGEFHTIRRQLDRLAEESVEVVKVAALPAATLAERLAGAVDGSTAAVLVSSVLFQNAHIVQGLGGVMEACQGMGAELLVDAYHQVNVVPFSISDEGLEQAFVVGGGYKYVQMGEGNCYLRFPSKCALRPVITGWFSEFEMLAEEGAKSRTPYGHGPARFAGATYDPTSHYRAAAVLDFFRAQGMTPQALRETSQHQVRLLAESFDGLDADPSVIDRDRSVPLEDVAGFLALRTPRAGELSAALSERGVMTDYRSDTLRLGPAPYLTDGQLQDAVAVLHDVVVA